MNMCRTVSFYLLMTIVLLFGTTSGSKFILEAEDAIVNGRLASHNIVPRSKASNQKSVISREGDVFKFEFCLPSARKVHIDDVRYSNDGHSDTFVLLAVDNQRIATIDTVQRYWDGRGWNDFISLDKPLEFFIQNEGKHTLTLEIIKADSFGVEMDNVVLTVDGEIDVDLFRCILFCFNDNIKVNDDLTRYTLFPIARIEQRSKGTKCAEEDNINIPMYSEIARSFAITALLPLHKSFRNNRDPDFSECTMLTALWSFGNIIFENDRNNNSRFHKSSIGPKHTKHKDGNVAALIAGFNSDKMIIDIVFKVEGVTSGVVDADIGSVLHVTLRSVRRDVIVVLQYKGRTGRWSEGKPKMVTSDMLHQTWHIPDFTWLENGENHIKVEVHSWERHIEMENIELRRRDKEPTRIFHMYDDGERLVEGASIDFWWLINQTMTVKILDTGGVFYEADYFRIYQRKPWTEHMFSQIFVIYQDGNIRILPYAPPQFDWIPFGSSILLGQTDPALDRPFASIKHIDIHMKSLTLWIYFSDGGSLTLQIIPNSNSTTIEVHDINYVKDRGKYPIVTFRSMWVSNGNSDVDHVIVDGRNDQHIISGWHVIEGSSFEFYRKCISKHNTQSPDILLDVKP